MGKNVTRYKRDDETIKLVGQNIRKYRDLKGLSINQLADMSGLSKNQISEYELGKVNQNVTSLKILSDTLGISIAQLFDEI